jgi:hypothetical protein
MGGRDRDSATSEADGVGSRGVRLAPARARKRRSLLGSLLVLCLAAVGTLAPSAPALASSEVDHGFSRSFQGELKCKLLRAGAIAVNESTGEVYVYDRANNSVDRLSPTGGCLTHQTLPGPKPAAEASIEGIAVDNSGTSPSAGDVYVAGENASEEAVVYKLKPEGGELKQVGAAIEPEFGVIHGLNVDKSGELWVYQGNSIDRFSNAVANASVSTVEVQASNCEALSGFSIGPKAEVFYVGWMSENTKEECEEKVPIALKVDSAGEPITAAPGEPQRNAQLDNEATTAVAADQTTGEVYFDNKTSVAAFSADGSFVQRFGAGFLEKSNGITVNSATGEIYATDAHEGQVVVFTPQATPPPPPPPSGGTVLPDGRAWEMVSPQNKLGAAIYPITLFGGVVQSSEDGNTITYTASAPIVSTPPTNRSPEPTSILSKRGGQAWSSEDIATPRSQVPIGYQTNSGNEYRFFTSNLSRAIAEPDIGLETPNEPPLSPEATETTFYWRTLASTSAECEPVPSTCYQAIVSPLNDTVKSPFGTKVHFLSATPDGSHAVFKSNIQLTRGAPEEEGLYEWGPDGSLKLVSLLPAGEKGESSDPRLGGPGEALGGIMRHAISNDGSRVYWQANEGALYMRDTSIGQTIRIDKAHGAHPEVNGATFQTASADGSKVFFTDTSRLTTDATEEGEESEGKGDLYECEIGEEAGKLTCPLVDLTSEVRAKNESANMQGVIGASEDGSYVYYVADGALTTNAAQGHCVPREKQEEKEEQEGTIPIFGCNLYVAHHGQAGWEPPKLIARLTTQDQHDWAIITNGGGALGSQTSRVSPEGGYVAFMSNSSLTGYNNVDAHSGARDEEVFLYNAATDRITCASCNPKGAQPSGVFDGGTNESSSEGQGRLIDRPFNWEGRWLAANLPGWTASSVQNALYQSRYLSDTGRLFFNSADALVPADANTKADVYEFEPNGQGTCASENGCVSLVSSGAEGAEHESAFLDASVSGSDVFFLSAQKLVPQDTDTGFDVYDARVCTSSSPCLTPPPAPPAPCEGEGCKPPASSQSALPSVPPSSGTGTGNAAAHQVLPVKVTVPPKRVETRAQKLAKALKACKKLKKKKKKLSCEKQAKKKYGPAKRAAKKKGKK